MLVDTSQSIYYICVMKFYYLKLPGGRFRKVSISDDQEDVGDNFVNVNDVLGKSYVVSASRLSSSLPQLKLFNDSEYSISKTN